MDSCEYVTFITAVACAIAKNVPKEELPLLVAAFTQLSNTLSTIIVKEAPIEELAEISPAIPFIL